MFFGNAKWEVMKMSAKSKSRKPKSKVSIRNMFRINTGKKVLLGVLVCAVVFGVYAGLHRYNSKAGYVTRGVVNDISEVHKDTSKKLGTPENPFVVLEIVPWSGYGEFGYLVDGCEPVDYRKIYTGNSMPGNMAYSQLKVVKQCFEEEEHPDSWIKKSENKTLYGYYERVEDGTGKFSIKGYKKVDDSKYEPEFAHDKNGDFNWVSLDEGSWGIDKYDQRVKQNKYAKSADSTADFVVGDRQFMSRTENVYYVYNNSMSNPEVKYEFYNDFMRESLKIRSQKEIDNYNIVVKVIEPSELNANPEWIDYTNFIYIHKTNKYGATVSNFWKDTQSGENSKYRKVRSNSKYKSYEGLSFGYDTSNGSKASEWGASSNDAAHWKNNQNDLSWEVAYNLFLKNNDLGK